MLLGFGVAGLLVFGLRTRRWRELDRRGRLFVVCGNLASIVAAVPWHRRIVRKPGDETRNLSTSTAASDKDKLHNPSAQSTATPAAPRFQYTVTDLGTLAGADESEAFGINNAGKVVGCAEFEDGSYRAFLWELRKGMQDLQVAGAWSKVDPALAMPAVELSSAIALNNKDEVTGYLKYDGGVCLHPFLWQVGAVKRGLCDLTPIGTGIYCEANAINDNGQVAGLGSDPGQGLDFHWFLWEARTGIQNRATLGGDTLGGKDVRQSMARGINNAQHVVGFCDDGTFARAFLWQAGRGMRDLGSLGGTQSFAHAINNADQVAGESDTGRGDRRSPTAQTWNDAAARAAHMNSYLRIRQGKQWRNGSDLARELTDVAGKATPATPYASARTRG